MELNEIILSDNQKNDFKICFHSLLSQAFYKDLNRLRRAALTFGFTDLLQGMAEALDRERNYLLIPSTPNTHLLYAIRQLEISINKGYDYQIEPMPGTGKHSKR